MLESEKKYDMINHFSFFLLIEFRVSLMKTSEFCGMFHLGGVHTFNSNILSTQEKTERYIKGPSKQRLLNSCY